LVKQIVQQLKFIKSRKPKVGRNSILSPKLLATSINIITKCSCLLIITQYISLFILKHFFGCKSLILYVLLVKYSKLKLEPQLNFLSTYNYNYKALRQNLVKSIFSLYMHFLDYTLLYLLSFFCDFSQMLYLLFLSNPINYEVWKNFSTSRVNGFKKLSITSLEAV